MNNYINTETENYIQSLVEKSKWGFLREFDDSGKDQNTGLFRTSVLKYLVKIFDNTQESDWIHDKIIPNSGRKCRPDYRNDGLKIVVEYDGLPHYTDPSVIKEDLNRNIFYSDLGYKVVRIPYFIQLTNKAVKTLFDIDVNEKLFLDGIPSLSPLCKNTPAFLCDAGVKRMAKEFKKFPEQYKTNLDYLKELDDEFLTGANLLENSYNNL